MLIDLLGLDNYVSYNIKIAELIGLHCAIYLSELMNINEKAVRKSALSNDYFTVDRAYIQKRTTLDKSEQISLDKTLIELGILKVDEERNNVLQLNLSVLISLLNDNNENIVSDLKEMKKALDKSSKKSGTKIQQSCEQMKSYIETDNPELYSAYCEWIDAVFAKLKWMSKKSVIVAQKTIDEFSNRDLDIALSVLELATANGYKDVTWAIKLYKENYEPIYRIKYSKNNSSKESDKKVELSEEVF